VLVRTPMVVLGFMREIECSLLFMFIWF